MRCGVRTTIVVDEATGSCRGEPGEGVLTDQLSLELREGPDDVKNGPSGNVVETVPPTGVKNYSLSASSCGTSSSTLYPNGYIGSSGTRGTAAEPGFRRHPRCL
jgi:hypothetical protein